MYTSKDTGINPFTKPIAMSDQPSWRTQIREGYIVPTSKAAKKRFAKLDFFSSLKPNTAMQQMQVELHKGVSKQFHTVLRSKNNKTTHSGEPVKNRVDALDTVIGVAADFGGYWDGWYEDHTKDVVVEKRHPVEKRGGALNIILTGASLVAKERQEQLRKHGKTVSVDVKTNPKGQLRQAAIALITPAASQYPAMPDGWTDTRMWKRIMNKPYEDRVIVAAAMLAAERDRLEAVGKGKAKKVVAKKSAPKKRSTPTYRGHIDNPLNVR